MKKIFQSTLPHGSDIYWLVICMLEIKFQSTLPHGSDCLTSSQNVAARFEFQSTLPHGSDCFQVLRLSVQLYFNPRSLTGATAWYGGEGALNYSISIHAPSRERHLLSFQTPGFWSKRFQSTLPHGSDGCRRKNVFLDCYFNPRSLTGATISKRWLHTP